MVGHPVRYIESTTNTFTLLSLLDIVDIYHVNLKRGKMFMTKPLYQQIYNYIIENIKSGQLKAGDKVPSEKELSEKFSVSRITSKKALDLLAQHQIIHRIRGKGSYISDKPHNVDPEKEIVQDTDVLDDNILIGAIFPDFDSAFGSKLLKSIEQKASEYKVSLVIKRTHGLIAGEEKAILSLVELGVKGLIIFPVDSEQYNREMLKLILEGFPVVVVDRDLKGIYTSTVMTDNKQAALQLTEYLFELGHEHISFISPPPKRTSTVDERLQGFQKAFLKHGLRYNTDYLLTEITSSLPPVIQSENYLAVLENDIETIKKLIMDHPQITAFVASEYGIAVTLKKALLMLEKQIPHDYSIVCFDCPDDPFDSPMFTHIRQMETEMGMTAVNLLMSQLKGDHVPMHTVMNYTLVKGRSTRSINV